MKKHLMPTLSRLNPDTFFSGLEGVFDNMVENWTGPSVNVSTNDYGHLIEVAAPGFNKEDFSVDVEDNKLTIRANYKNQKQDTQKDYTRKEFSYASFIRSFALPQDINPEEISAVYENGILKVNLGRLERPKTKSTSIKIE